ncbi:MAG: GntR family transcriptional regulator [Actinobacteria bacterium]|jgi:DNA-binding GntR family transcriptional regulator|nr:GntR family transcriptional regulator [Actinomycetota bacterium]NCW92933.1 GntR family transcriptional regulator [Actinomycetota bacterium]NCX16533.1 GntR family transcriptional regulator [Actinomycetota bacterium]NCX37791.1 GntR family transcriptional regulator [Actinomycetota bacterium]NCX39381.1 GntR family transcriptional regulator [Actinomycetota bacterium]
MLNIKNETDLALSQQIANSLKEEILSGKYPPGIRIRQEDIAEQFGASRSPVREALRILEAEGLINLVAHTGAWISHLSLSECEEMYQLRERIEPLLLRLSIPHITDSLVHELQKLVLQMEATTDVETFLRLDRQFHLLSYSKAETVLVGEMVNRLWNTTQHYRRAYSQMMASTSFKPAHYEHHLLLTSIIKGDLDDAERILFGHIRRTRLELAKHPDVFNS